MKNEDAQQLLQNVGISLDPSETDDFKTLLAACHDCAEFVENMPDYQPRPDLTRYPRQNVRRPTEEEQDFGHAWVHKFLIKGNPNGGLLAGKTVSLKDVIAVAGVPKVLLLNGHILGVLVGIPVESNLVSCVANLFHLLWEGLQRVTRNEPCCFDAVLVEELQQTPGSHGGCPNACSWGDVLGLVYIYLREKKDHNSPRLMSLVESSPPYEPSHPATASTSTP